MSIATEPELQHRHHPTSVENEVQPRSWPIVFPLDAQIKVSLTDFQRLCSLNQETRLERSAEGDLILMPPESSWSGHRTRKSRNILASGQINMEVMNLAAPLASSCPTEPADLLNPVGFPSTAGPASAPMIGPDSPESVLISSSNCDRPAIL